MGCGCGKKKKNEKWVVKVPGQPDQTFTSLAEANHAKRKAGAGSTLKKVA